MCPESHRSRRREWPDSPSQEILRIGQLHADTGGSLIQARRRILAGRTKGKCRPGSLARGAVDRRPE